MLTPDRCITCNSRRHPGRTHQAWMKGTHHTIGAVSETNMSVHDSRAFCGCLSVPRCQNQCRTRRSSVLRPLCAMALVALSLHKHSVSRPLLAQTEHPEAQGLPAPMSCSCCHCRTPAGGTHTPSCTCGKRRSLASPPSHTPVQSEIRRRVQ